MSKDIVTDPANHTTNPNLVLAICCLSVLIVGMDVTVMNVALPTIQKHYQMAQDLAKQKGVTAD